MKKMCGVIFQILAFLLIAGALTIPLSVLAFHYAGTIGEAKPGAVYLFASLLICVIVVYVATKIPCKKARFLWAFLFGMGIYAALGYFAVFGFAKETLSIFTPFGLGTANDILCYVGAGIMLFGIVIGAQGRYFVRDSEKPKKAGEPPRITAAETTLKPETVVMHTSALSAPSQAVSLQPIVAPMTYMLPDTARESNAHAAVALAPAAANASPAPIREKSEEGESHVFTPVDAKQIKYARDKWGNLVVFEKNRP